MATSPDFDERFRQLHTIFHTFHTDFIQNTTREKYDPSAVISLKKQIQFIHDALKYFLSECLGEDATCESTIKNVTVMVNGEEDRELTTQVQTLLTDLCPLMFPWDPQMNARVGGLFDKFSEHPFSPVNLDVAEADSIPH